VNAGEPRVAPGSVPALGERAMAPRSGRTSAEPGLVPAGEGWFVLNARETRWWDREGRGVAGDFDGGPWDRSSPRGLPVEGRSLDSSRAELA
jgi:hypothetical protein